MGRLSDLLSGRTTVTAAESLAAELAAEDYGLVTSLIRIRESRGITQADLAGRLEVSQQSVSKFEQMDSDPRLSTIRRYAIAVGASIRHDVQAHDGRLLRHDLDSLARSLTQAPNANTSGSAILLQKAEASTFSAVFQEMNMQVVE